MTTTTTTARRPTLYGSAFPIALDCDAPAFEVVQAAAMFCGARDYSPADWAHEKALMVEAGDLATYRASARPGARFEADDGARRSMWEVASILRETAAPGRRGLRSFERALPGVGR